MLHRLIPGTTLSRSDQPEKSPFLQLEPFFKAAGGLTLSQISGLSGLEPSTIQNWVKRGYVSKTVGKRYTEVHCARILIINVLRDTMQLDQIDRILRYVNGSVDDRSDDIISDSELFQHLCSVIMQLEETPCLSDLELLPLIETELETYQGPTPDSRFRLTNALHIMLLAYCASGLQKKAQKLFRESVEEQVPC